MSYGQAEPDGDDLGGFGRAAQWAGENIIWWNARYDPIGCCLRLPTSQAGEGKIGPSLVSSHDVGNGLAVAHDE